jgi:hypothetical protein
VRYRLLALIATISLVLSVITATLAARSLLEPDGSSSWEVRIFRPTFIHDRHGRLYIYGYQHWIKPVRYRVLGFYFNMPPSNRTSPWLLAIPYWFPLLITLVLPSWFVTRQRQTMSGGGALCRRCGYDLRATPDHCPECGTVAV